MSDSTPDVAEVARKLSAQQREAVITGRAATEQDGLALFRMGITRRDLRSRVKVYSDLGLAVRAHLQEQSK